MTATSSETNSSENCTRGTKVPARTAIQSGFASRAAPTYARSASASHRKTSRMSVYGTEHLQQKNSERYADDDDAGADGDEQAERGGHPCDASTCFDWVADEHADERDVQEPAWVMLADDVEQSLAGDLPQLR